MYVIGTNQVVYHGGKHIFTGQIIGLQGADKAIKAGLRFGKNGRLKSPEVHGNDTISGQ